MNTKIFSIFFVCFLVTVSGSFGWGKQDEEGGAEIGVAIMPPEAVQKAFEKTFPDSNAEDHEWRLDESKNYVTDVQIEDTIAEITITPKGKILSLLSKLIRMEEIDNFIPKAIKEKAQKITRYPVEEARLEYDINTKKVKGYICYTFDERYGYQYEIKLSLDGKQIGKIKSKALPM